MDTKVDWIIHYVFDDSGPYPYLCNAHTHGMKKYHHLDFQMVLNLPQEHICYLLNTLGRRVQNGETFHDGDMVSGLYEDCSIRLGLQEQFLLFYCLQFLCCLLLYRS